MKYQKGVSVLIAAAMAAGMSTTAFAAEGNTFGGAGTSVDGSGDVQNPIIRYQIPTDLDFAINAFQKKDDSKSQIYSPNFQVINKSDVAIKVDVATKVVAKTDVALKAKDAVNVTDVTNTDKEAYMEIAAASATTGVTTSAASGANKASAAIGSVKTAPTSTTATYAPGSASTKATYTIPLAGAVAGDAGILSLVFGGSMVASEPVTANDADTAIAGKFATKTITIDGVVFTAATSGTTLTFTAAANGEIPGAASQAFSLIGSGGTEGTYTIGDVTWTGAYGGDALAAVGLGTDEVTMSFGLDKATYVKPTTDAGYKGEENLFDALAVSSGKLTGASVFRFMGTVNPAADWKKDDLKVTAVFKVSGLSPDMYAKSVTDASADAKKGANVIQIGSGVEVIPTTTDTTSVTAIATVQVKLAPITGKPDITKIVSAVEKGTPANKMPGTQTFVPTTKAVNLSIGAANLAAVKGKTYIVTLSSADDSYQPVFEITFKS